MRRPLLFWGFRSSREMLESSLGVLERQVMTLVWNQGETSVRDARDRIGSEVAYTTIMTTMDRLFRKGLLARRKVGRAFLYHATASRAEMEGAVATDLVHSLLQRADSNSLPILSSLVDVVSEGDRTLLDELERLVREKRRALARRRPE
ncbi:MAG TPA: BlaI/MecI/CopY family transcriptional regulator [Vicinamibacterales bacterium]|nr:BlaI/MecI/CopY family transcriptional regulator [Vicinamibacterales bacterium]